MHQINEKIRAKEVRLVGDNVKPGVYPLTKALEIAKEQELDLVVISDKAEPFISRILDYGVSRPGSPAGGCVFVVWREMARLTVAGRGVTTLTRL